MIALFKAGLINIKWWIIVCLVSLIFIYLVPSFDKKYMVNIISAMLIFGGPFMTLEKYEEKNNGYSIMKELPLKSMDIVKSRFLLVLVLLALNALINIVMVIITSSSAMEIIGITIFSTEILLLVSPLVYIMLFRFGYTKSLLPIIFSYVVVMIFPTIIMSDLFENIGRTLSYQIFASFPWILMLITSLIVFLVLLNPAIKVFSKHWREY